MPTWRASWQIASRKKQRSWIAPSEVFSEAREPRPPALECRLPVQRQLATVFERKIK
jgi:hypothetical protein